MTDVILHTDKLRKEFGDVVAVADIDLTVRRGEIFGFLGPNGAGKTTTISMILGLLHPTAGSVEILGERVTPTTTGALRHVGSLVGEPGMMPYLSGRDNLHLLAQVEPNVDAVRVEELLEQVDIMHAADRKVQGYSTGMKQRLGLAAALLHEPDLLVLDEPTSGLDPSGMRDMRRLLTSLAGHDVTVFLSSHLLHEVEQVCDRVAVLDEGHIVTSGVVDELLSTGNVVRVNVSSPDSAARILKNEPDISYISMNDGYLELRGMPSEEIVRRLAEDDIYPSEVYANRTDLETLFLESTQSQPARAVA